MTIHDGFRVERDAERGVATITLDVPEQAEPRLDGRPRPACASVFEELGRDETVRAIVLRGAGAAFTAGGDIAGFLETHRRRSSRGSPGTSRRPSGARSR